MVINLVIGLGITIGVAGTEYVSPAQTPTNSTEYEQHFNATEIAEGWSATPFSGIPLIGDIFAGFNFLWQIIGYLVDGLPTLIVYLGESFITDVEGLTVFYLIADCIRAVEAALIALFLIEFISGRVFTD